MAIGDMVNRFGGKKSTLNIKETVQKDQEKRAAQMYRPFTNDTLNNMWMQKAYEYDKLGSKSPLVDAENDVIQFMKDAYESDKLGAKDPLGAAQKRMDVRSQEAMYNYKTKGITDYAGLKALWDAEGFTRKKPHQGTAEENQADFDFYTNLTDYLGLVSHKGYEALPENIRGAFDRSKFGQGTGWNAEMPQEEWDYLNAWGDEMAQNYKPYTESPYQQHLWQQMIKTPEGAQEWLNEALGTEDEQAARDNLYFVENDAKYNAITQMENYADLSKPEEKKLGVFAKEADRKYAYINNQGNIRAEIDGAMNMTGASNPWAIYQEMSPEEVGKYNYLMAEEGEKAAEEYLEYLSYDLDKRRNTEFAQEMYQLAGENGFNAAVMSLASVPMSVSRGINYLDVVGQHFFNGDKPINYERTAGMGIFADSSRQGVMDTTDWNMKIFGRDWDVFDFIYGTAMSGADSMAAGAFGPAGGAMLLGTSAAQSSMQQARDNGASDAEAILTGAGAGAFEYIFEKISIGKFLETFKATDLDNPAQWLKNLGINALTNASEEFATSVADFLWEQAMLGEKSEMAQKYQYYLDMGLNEKEANARVAQDLGWQFAEDAVGGALMGSGMGLVGDVGGATNTHQNDKQAGKSVQGNQMEEHILEIAKGMGKESEAGKAAARYERHKSAAGLGRVFRETLKGMGQQEKKGLYDMTFAKVRNDLLEAGETENVDQVAVAIVDLYAGNKLDGEEMQAMAASRHGMEVAERLLGMGGLHKAEMAKDLPGEAPKAEQEAPKAEQEAHQAEQEAPTEMEVGGETKAIQEIREDDDGEVSIVTDAGETIAISDEGLTESQKGIMNEARATEYAAQTMAAYTDAESQNTKAADFAKGFNRIAQAAAKGATMEEATKGIYARKMSQEAQQKAYAAGQQARTRKMQQESSATNQAAKRDGFEQYTKETGSKAGLYYAKVTREVNDAEKTMLALLDRFANDYGMQIRVYEDIEGKNGVYYAGTNVISVSLNADAGAITRVVSHEGYHYIKEWNREAADKLGEMVLSALQEKDGYDLDTRIKEKMAAYKKAGVTLSEDGAKEEIIADALLDYIGTEANLKALLQENESLFNRIQNWLNQMIARIRSYLDEIAGSNAEVRAMKDDIAYMEKAAAMMQEALAGAMESRQAAKKGESAIIKNDEAVQEYREDMRSATNQEDRKAALRGLMASAFMRTQKAWLQAHPDATDAEIQAAIEKFSDALTAYGRGEKWVQAALEDAGFLSPTPGSRDMALLSFAGQQAAQMQEMGEKFDIKKENGETRYDFTKPFSEQVDDFKIPGKFPQSDTLLLGRTPEILREMGISDLPMVLNRTHLEYMMYGKESSANDDHMFSEKTIKNLPELIANPVAVIAADKKYEAESVNIIIKAESKTKKQGFAAVRINGIGKQNGIRLDVNSVSTVFGNNDAAELIKKAISKEVKRKLGSGNEPIGVFYINKKDTDILLEGTNEQKVGGFLKEGVNHSITDPGSPVKEKTIEQTESQQFKRWFKGSMAKNKDGTPIIFYHGTPNGTFDIFKDWQYFTSNEEYANVYQSQGASSNGYKKTADNPKTYAVYLQTGKVFDTRKKKERDIFQNEFFGQWGNGTPLSDRGLPDWTDGDDLIEFLEENGYEYDTILLDEGGTGGYGEEVKDRGISYVIRDSRQIKSATDNVGLFDENNPNIKYSIKEENAAPAEEGLQEDAELYAQMRESEEAKAALAILRKLYNVATQGDTYLQKGENEALIEKGAWKKRLPEMMEKIKKETGSQISDAKMRKMLSELFTAMDNGENVNDMLMAARDMAKDILFEAPGMTNPIDPGVKGALRILKERKFYLTDEMKSEIRETQYGSVAAYMRKNFGKMAIRAKNKDGKGGARVSLAEVWQELSEILPGTFAADATEADMPGIVDAWLETAGQRDFGGAYGQNIGAYSTDLGLSMMLEYFNLPGAMEKEKAMRTEFEKSLLDMRTAERVKYEEKTKTRQQKQELTKAKEMAIKEIGGSVKYLNARIIRESNSNHIPEMMKGAVIKAMAPFLNDTSVFDGDMLMKLRQAYEAMAQNGVNADTEAARAFDEDILENIKKMESTIAGRRLSQLTLEELWAVRDMMGNIKTMVVDANEMLVNGRKVEAEALGNEELMDLESKADAKHEGLNAVAFKNTTPIYFFKRIGGVMQEMWNDFRDGQDKWAKWMRDAKTFADKMIEDHGMAKWLNGKETLRFKTQRGEMIELNRQLALSIYATWQRETTNTVQNANHLRMGGFRYPKGTKAYEGVGMKRPHALTSVDMLQIKGFLGKSAMEFADKMVGYLSNDMAKIGNEVSMQLYGYRKFTEKYYFPYQSSSDFINEDLTKEKVELADASGALKGWGAAKKLQTKANNPVEIGNFMDVWAGHVNKMCIYGAFTIPADNMNRLYNYKTPVDSDMTPTSVKQELSRVYGDGAGKYIATLIRDIAGGVSKQDRTRSGKLISKFKKGSVAGNLQVVIQQPSAIARAMAVMNPKYLMIPSVHIGENIREMMEHSGVAIIKQMGRFDTGTGLSAVDWLQDSVREGKFIKRNMERMDKFTGWGAEKADQMTWAHLWHAVKKEVEANAPGLKIGSSEYFQEVTRRFEEIVDYTQVYDSVLSKSELMRSNSAYDKMATSFMAEPTVTYNMLQDAIVNAKQMGGKRKILRATSVWVVSTAFNAMLKSLVSAIRRKDDEERTYIEKYIAELWGNFSGDMDPISLIPLGRDIASLLEGYDVERADMAIIAQIVDAWDILWNENKTFKEKIQAVTWAAGNAVGVPAKNIWRDTEALLIEFMKNPDRGTDWQYVKYSVLDETPAILGKIEIWDDKAAAYYERMALALNAGDMAKYEELKGYMEGPEQKKPDSVKKGVKSAVKDLLLDGEMTRDDAEEILMEQYEMTETKAYYQVEEWIQTEADESWTQYGEFLDAVASGKNLPAVIKEYMSHGISKSTLSSQITTEYKKQYIALYKTDRAKAANMKAMLLTAYAALGYDRKEKSKQIDDWLKE